MSIKMNQNFKISGIFHLTPLELSETMSLYLPMIGSEAFTLYIVMSELEKDAFVDWGSHELLFKQIGYSNRQFIQAREILEVYGLLQTFEKNDDNSVQRFYQVCSPLRKNEFLENKEFSQNLETILGGDLLKKLGENNIETTIVKNEVNRNDDCSVPNGKNISKKISDIKKSKIQSTDDYIKGESNKTNQREDENEVLMKVFEQANLQSPISFLENIRRQRGGVVTTSEKKSLEQLIKFNRLPISIINMEIYVLTVFQKRNTLPKPLLEATYNDWAQHKLKNPIDVIKYLQDRQINLNRSNKSHTNKVVETKPDWNKQTVNEVSDSKKKELNRMLDNMAKKRLEKEQGEE